jgi:peptide-methionine (R)-S-oxide reductase
MKFGFIVLIFAACQAAPKTTQYAGVPASGQAGVVSDSLVPPQYADGKLVKSTKTDAEWEAVLTAQEFYVLRREGTERAFSGDLWNSHEAGTFVCAGCGLPLFGSDTKFDSGTGWPSFYQPLTKDCIVENTDNSYGMRRVEVACARCGGHQGHVFEDGPKPTGLRYCINSVSLNFVKK